MTGFACGREKLEEEKEKKKKTELATLSVFKEEGERRRRRREGVNRRFKSSCDETRRDSRLKKFGGKTQGH